jgi:hypothetical protein
MNAPTTHNINHTNEAPFLAPETHQRAGVQTEFTTILQEALTRTGIVNQAYRAFHN